MVFCFFQERRKKKEKKERAIKSCFALLCKGRRKGQGLFGFFGLFSSFIMVYSQFQISNITDEMR